MQIIPQKIKLAGENNALTIQWSDGHLSAYPYQRLRDRCPCATCTEAGPPEPAAPSPLKLYTRTLRPAREWRALDRTGNCVHWSYDVRGTSAGTASRQISYRPIQKWASW